MPLSSRLELPYLEPAQAQKHVTHNEALRDLDMLVQMTVEGFDENTPPALPITGQIFALGAAPTGDWAGQADMLALREEGGWHFVAPRVGWTASLAGSTDLRIWSGSAWNIATGQTQNLTGLGVNTSSDPTNRLAVAAPASLLTHEGADHRLTINKATDTDTASLLFQSGWTGHAEMGLAGETGFSIKVSPDGGTWASALEIDPATGSVSAQTGLEVTGHPAYHTGNLLGVVSQSGGLPTGAVIEEGNNANGRYTRLADGTQICQGDITYSNVSCSLQYAGGYRSGSLGNSLTFAAAFATAPTLGFACTDVSLSDMICFASGTKSSTAWQPRFWRSASGTGAFYGEYLAIGRWF